LLEVKTPLNRRFSRQAQWAARVLPFVGLATVLVLFVWGAWRFAGRRLFYDNPEFKVRAVEAKSDGVIPPDEIRRWTGVQKGQSLMKLDVARIKAQIERVALVREAHVSKSFPDRVVVQVVERVAVARLVPQDAPAAVYFVDGNGVAFTAVRGSDGRIIAPMGTQKLAVMTGVAANQITIGQPVRAEGVSRAIDVIRRCDRMGLTPLLGLRGVDVAQAGVLKLVMGRGGVVFLDQQELDAQLRRLHVIVWRAKNERREVKTADLRPARNVTVTYF
jgi:cell division septal protein FtsQ